MAKGKKPNERLKHYLRGGRYYRNKAEYLFDKIEVLKSQAEKMTTTFSQAPTFGGYTDHRQAKMDELGDRQREYRKLIERCRQRLIEIQRFIDMLEDEDERSVCELYYVFCEDNWQDVAIRLHFSLRYIHDLHSDALRHLSEIHEKMVANGKPPLY